MSLLVRSLLFLKSLLGKEERQSSRYENKQALASKFNNFMAKIEHSVASIDTVTSHENQCIRRTRMSFLGNYPLMN